MPAAKVFIDTNILLYSHDRRDLQKFAASREWLEALAIRGLGCTNLQVLNECAHLLLRKRWFRSTSEAYAVVEGFRVLGDSSVTWVEVEQARSLHDQTGYSWWDCLLLASAIALGCTHFLSEDLQDGRTLDGLTILSPFAHSPRDILA
jgi:predicted nucleic acid-binding protein